ncbi:MAG: Holliday junction branch migration protein RuvA [Propionibacteriaceae bacterium]|jgi:Holliday junction DNA helicase RuvA|nr:Holliday junction branch migration protein RuvA [Propionibacteriaceae bacterium]
MIVQLTGTVLTATATTLVIDVGGVGFAVLASPNAAAAARPGEPTTVFTSFIVREDSMTLYGFATAEERELFELVQSVSGVGPKTALAAVSVLPPEEFQRAIATENLMRLTQIPGVGKKGAQRMVLELKDKVGELAVIAHADAPATWRDQVRSGLEGLGWSARDAEAAMDSIADLANSTPQPSVATLMKAALQALAK